MKFPNEAFDYINNTSLVKKIYYYITDSKYRTIEKLSDTLNKQIYQPSQEIVDLAFKIVGNENEYDKIVIKILKWLRYNIIYNSDTKTYGMSEKWAPAEDILTRWYKYNSSGKLELVHIGWDCPISGAFRSDDCDGGNSLIYVLARLAGVPENRLLIGCGDVMGGGHYYCLYRPLRSPWNVVILDWCYYYDSTAISERQQYFIQDNELKILTNKENYYKKIWWLFNESYSFSRAKLPWE